MLVPLLEADGKFSEANIKELLALFIRPRLAGPTLPATVSEVSHEPTIEAEHFDRHEFGYEVSGGRFAFVYCYVSENFARGNPARRHIIDGTIKRDAPWVFSYAERKTRGEQR